jgi:hypothetical protein
MDTGAWVGLLGTVVVLLALVATLVPRIRQHRTEQERSRAIDKFHRTREATSDHAEKAAKSGR